jgi:hypothetical protein
MNPLCNRNMWWNSTVQDGGEATESILQYSNMKKKRHAWNCMVEFCGPAPSVCVDPSEPVEFFAWCRHHEISCGIVAHCSITTCGEYPGTPLNITRVRRHGGTEVIDMRMYEPRWGMPVHVALDRLRKIENAVMLTWKIYETDLMGRAFFVLLDHAEHEMRVEMYYSPTTFPWMLGDRRYVQYHARQQLQCATLATWNLKHLGASDRHTAIQRRNHVLRSAGPCMVRELLALNIRVDSNTDVATMKAMMMDAMGWQMPPPNLWSIQSVKYIRTHVLCTTIKSFTYESMEEAASDLHAEILERFPRGLPVNNGMTYGTTVREEERHVHKRLVSTLAQHAKKSKTRMERLLECHRRGCDFYRV